MQQTDSLKQNTESPAVTKTHKAKGYPKYERLRNDSVLRADSIHKADSVFRADSIQRVDSIRKIKTKKNGYCCTIGQTRTTVTFEPQRRIMGVWLYFIIIRSFYLGGIPLRQFYFRIFKKLFSTQKTLQYFQ